MAKVQSPPPEQTIPNDWASWRIRKGITLGAIAEATKIGVRTLEAIEKGQFDKLPGGIYSTAYIRQYARFVDLDEDTLLQAYYTKMGIQPRPPVRAKSQDGGPIARLFRTPTAAGL
jgi:cytoskeletal protein RodZ